MKITVTTAFYDQEAEGKLRKVGTAMEVSKERGAALVKLGLANAGEDAAEPTPSLAK